MKNRRRKKGVQAPGSHRMTSPWKVSLSLLTTSMTLARFSSWFKHWRCRRLELLCILVGFRSLLDETPPKHPQTQQEGSNHGVRDERAAGQCWYLPHCVVLGNSPRKTLTNFYSACRGEQVSAGEIPCCKHPWMVSRMLLRCCSDSLQTVLFSL